MKTAEYYLKAGDQYRQRKKWQEAETAYSKAIKLNQTDFRSHERHGRVCFELGEYQQVISSLTQAIALKPNRYLLYDLRGRAHSMLGNREEVVSDFLQATELHPGHNVYLHKALAFSNLKEYDLALADLNRALELKADYAYAYLKRGEIYQRLGKKKQALADYQRTIDLDTNRSWSVQAREHLQALEDDEGRAG